MNIAAVEIHVEVGLGEQLRFDGIGNSLSNRAGGKTRIFTVQVLAVIRTDVLKLCKESRGIDGMNNSNTSCNISGLQFLGNADTGFHTRIFSAMSTTCDNNGFTFFCTVNQGNGHLYRRTGYLKIPFNLCSGCST